MTYSATLTNSYPIPIEPGVLGPIRVTRAGSEINMGVYIPWEHCKLVYAYAVTTTVVAAANLELDLELNAASGTEMMTATIATSGSAFGDITEFTFTTAAACRDLGAHDTSRDFVNIEIGANAGAGAADVYLYFEPDWG